jgi:hypothetical protein
LGGAVGGCLDGGWVGSFIGILGVAFSTASGFGVALNS